MKNCLDDFPGLLMGFPADVAKEWKRLVVGIFTSPEFQPRVLSVALCKCWCKQDRKGYGRLWHSRGHRHWGGGPKFPSGQFEWQLWQLSLLPTLRMLFSPFPLCACSEEGTEVCRTRTHSILSSSGDLRHASLQLLSFQTEESEFLMYSSKKF